MVKKLGGEKYECGLIKKRGGEGLTMWKEFEQVHDVLAGGEREIQQKLVVSQNDQGRGNVRNILLRMKLATARQGGNEGDAKIMFCKQGNPQRTTTYKN